MDGGQLGCCTLGRKLRAEKSGVVVGDEASRTAVRLITVAEREGGRFARGEGIHEKRTGPLGGHQIRYPSFRQ